MRDQVLWRKIGRIAALLAERLDIDTERALDILYNSHTYTLSTTICMALIMGIYSGACLNDYAGSTD